jgi:hypothetical protein
VTITDVGVGDVLAVRTGGWASALIRFGSLVAGHYEPQNHVAVVHHYDSKGIWWGVEGRPGGTGWVDVRNYLASKWTVSNAAQPRTDAQRQMVATTVAQMLGSEYDWVGIAADAVEDLNLPVLFCQNWNGKGAPLHVVCSSLAAYAHRVAGLAKPAIRPDRFVQPADWAAFDQAARW